MCFKSESSFLVLWRRIEGNEVNAKYTHVIIISGEMGPFIKMSSKEIVKCEIQFSVCPTGINNPNRQDHQKTRQPGLLGAHPCSCGARAGDSKAVGTSLTIPTSLTPCITHFFQEEASAFQPPLAQARSKNSGHRKHLCCLKRNVYSSNCWLWRGVSKIKKLITVGEMDNKWPEMQVGSDARAETWY